MPEAIVSGAFLVVDENIVGFAQFLESFLGGLVARILIGMKLYGEFSICALNLFAARGARDSEDFVVVTLGGHSV